MYTKNPMEIENRSMDIIEEAMEDTAYSQKEKVIVKRMIHATGDFEYRKIIDFRGAFVEKALDSIEEGGVIFTDSKMACMGINKRALSKTKCSLKYFIDDEKTYALSKELNTTRAAAAIEIAVEEGIDMFVIGNAPTALFRLLELVKEGKVKPRFIVGVPVGFVGAAESKELLRE
ncbi:MAG: precorrin-8X methylmutase, partial [Tissierellia bacterium]|nr:precorrin-8X methylmutase [Tissierellia bacterium]